MAMLPAAKLDALVMRHRAVETELCRALPQKVRIRKAIEGRQVQAFAVPPGSERDVRTDAARFAHGQGERQGVSHGCARVISDTE